MTSEQERNFRMRVLEYVNFVVPVEDPMQIGALGEKEREEQHAHEEEPPHQDLAYPSSTHDQLAALEGQGEGGPKGGCWQCKRPAFSE